MIDRAHDSLTKPNLLVAEQIIEARRVIAATIAAFVLVFAPASVPEMADLTGEAFRLAWTTQYIVWVVAAVGVAVYARKARDSETFDESPVPVTASEH